MATVINVNQSPVFVVGYPRSGTTLLQGLLATQTGIASFPETFFFNKILPLALRCSRNENVTVDAVLELIAEVTHLKRTELAMVEERLADWQGPKELFEALVADSLKHYNPTEAPDVRWVEKTPRHAFHLGQILKFYPKAKILHTVREPISCITSNRRLEGDWGVDSRSVDIYAFDIKNCIGQSQELLASSPEVIRFVKLEDLVRNPKGTMKGVCEFIGHPYDPKLLDRRNEVAQKIVLQNEAWKKSAVESKIQATPSQEGLFSDFEKFRIQEILKDFMDRLGYELKPYDISGPASFSTTEVVRAIQALHALVIQKNDEAKEHKKVKDWIYVQRNLLENRYSELQRTLSEREEILKNIDPEKQQLLEQLIEKDQLIKSNAGRLFSQQMRLDQLRELTGHQKERLNYLVAEKNRLAKSMRVIRASFSFRLGRLLTLPIRIIIRRERA